MIKIDPAMLAGLPFELHAEVSENLFRKDWTPSEIDTLRRRCEAVLKAQAKKNQAAAGPASGRGAKRTGSGNLPEPVKGQVRDKIGAFAGISGRQVEKIAEVVEAYETEPEQFGHLREIIDRPHGVSKAYFALRRARDQQRVLNLAPVAGKFKTLVVDPPWPGDTDFLGRAKPPYALMTREQILALPVPSWAEENAHLYLWTTNSNIPLACECMAAWEFQHKSMLTWAKPRFGMGSYFRGQTEHVLFGVRGTLGTRRKDISTIFEAPVGQHSAKPDKFYEIVRAASYLPVGEAFQRKARPDFVNLYERVAEAAE